ncbi:MAG: TIR domain-containing protein [Clostridia bacterium]|nr:TIR domain-containing protein [Clostridia bacterium]
MFNIFGFLKKDKSKSNSHIEREVDNKTESKNNSTYFDNFICPNCQNTDYEVKGSYCVCKYCLSKFKKKEMSKDMFVKLNLANVERNSTNFNKASSIYNQIIKEYPDEDLSDVYFGQFLCNEKVVFEEDGKGNKFPSFYKISESKNSVMKNTFLNKAIDYAKENNKDRIEVYTSLANKIKDAKDMYTNIKDTTEPFDVFICFKNSDENGNHTKDRELAMDIYNEFSDTYNIFFSEKTLKDIKSNYREYEPNIYYGLYTAKVMLLICSKKEYLESKWLKNEWSRFTQINKQGNENKCIIPIFTNDFNPENLPSELWHNQGIFDDRKLMNTIQVTLKNIINPVDKIEELKKEQQIKLEKQREELLKAQEKERLKREQQIKEQQEKYEILEKKVIKLQEYHDRVNKGIPALNSYGDTILFGNFVQDNEKPEPITWRIIEKNGNKMTIVSDKILFASKFDDKTNEFKNSYIKKWLNNDFYNTAFTDEQKVYIEEVSDENGKNKVNLLSVQNYEKQFEYDKHKEQTKYALDNGAKYCEYWLNVASNSNTQTKKVECVDKDGKFVSNYVDSVYLGVVPVLTISYTLTNEEINKRKKSLQTNK